MRTLRRWTLAAVSGLALACGGGSGAPAAPAAFALAGGDGQFAPASTHLPEPLVVAVYTAAGAPAAGATVRFQVTDGGGAVDADVVISDGAGQATTGFTTGPTGGLQLVAVSVDGVEGILNFVARVLGPPATLTGALAPLDGEPGSTVPDAASVQVTDAWNYPLADVEVQFRILRSGGTLEHPTARTDALGRASCGAWTLGAVQGEQRLEATAGSASLVLAGPLASAAFGLSAAVSPNDATVEVETVGSSFAVRAIAPGGNVIAAASAAVGASFEEAALAAQVPFTWGTARFCTRKSGCWDIPAWVGTLSTAGLAGPATVLLTATDEAGQQARYAFDVIVDPAAP